MSWFTNLVTKTSTNTNISKSKNSGKVHLYISIKSTRVCFLSIDEQVSPPKIIAWEEIQLGPIEDLSPGQPVKDLFGSIVKLLTSHKEKFQDIDGISVSIPADGVFFRNVEVPKVKPEDMQKLVLAEIKKTLPVDFSQILFAQNDLGEKKENTESFFCVGIQKMLFENYKNIFAQFGLTPYFEIEVFSLARMAARDNELKMILQIGRTMSYLIFLEGQIVQDVKILEMGENDINKVIMKDLGLTFDQVEVLKNNYGKLQDNNRLGANVMSEYFKELDQKLAKAVSLSIMEYERNHNVEVKQIMICGTTIATKIRKIITEEFDSELKVDFVKEENFGDFTAENFLLEDLKRYAQCFGLAMRGK